MASPTQPASGPIFVRGMSRSGGTLMVTILDAHPDIAMSYELYANLLELEDGSAPALLEIAEQIARSPDLVKASKTFSNKRFGTYLARCPRSGLDRDDLAALFRAHAAEDDFQTPAGRLRFMGRCCRLKMEREGKSRWGVKCLPRFEEYLEVWPDAYFVNLLRDGRDVLSSQLNTGSFQNTPADVGRSWSHTHLKFRALLDDPAVNAHEVRYEALVHDPEPEVRALAEFLGAPYSPSMLSYYAEDLTIYGTSHLSMDRISTPMDEASVGRWRRDLSPEQLEAFYDAAGDTFELLGYRKDADAPIS